MNQLQIRVRKERTLDRARLIASAKRVRRSTVNESRNIWLVGSQNPKTLNAFYKVTFDAELDCFTCTCKAYEFPSDNTCKHIYACSLYEGGLV